MPDFGPQLDVHEHQLPFPLQYTSNPSFGAVFDEYYAAPAAHQQSFAPALPTYQYLPHYDHVSTAANYPRALVNPDTAYYTDDHRAWSSAQPEYNPPQRDVIVYDVSHTIPQNSPGGIMSMSRPMHHQHIREPAYLPQQPLEQYDDGTDILDSPGTQRADMPPPSIHSSNATEQSPGSDDTAFRPHADRPKPTPHAHHSKKDAKGDPCASAFIQTAIGEKKWEIFTARLAEKRVGRHKGKYKATPTIPLSLQGQDHSIDTAPDADASSKDRSASVIDFLVKVEIVKAVLRAYVPHPYNPLKSLTHPYEHAPSGHVTLTRSTILALCGWSNTQFSYWARRAEAVSVLAPHDVRLRAVAHALEHQLRAACVMRAPAQPEQSGGAFDGVAAMTEEWVDTCVTGKGLDNIIDEVKKRSGASPFLRGRHSSLDPFGTISVDTEGAAGAKDTSVAGLMCMPTFQAEMYVHEPPEAGHERERHNDHTDHERSPQVGSSQSQRRSWDVSSAHSNAGAAPTMTVSYAEQEHAGPVPQLSFQLSDSRGQSLTPRTLGGGSVGEQHAYAPLRVPTLSDAPRPRSSSYLLPFPKVLGDPSPFAEMHPHPQSQIHDQLERPRKKRKSI